jgi:hypothetical protein
MYGTVGFSLLAPKKGGGRQSTNGRRCNRTMSRIEPIEPVRDAQLDGAEDVRLVVGRECIQRDGPPVT